MSVSKNYEKKIFEGSEFGKKLAYVRRFFNIKGLVDSLTEEDKKEISRLREENEKMTIEDNRKVVEFTKEIDAKIHKRFEETIDKEIEIYKRVENNFKNK